MKKFFVLLLTILILTASVGCQQQLAATTTPEKQSPIELHIAAAASLTDVMQELAAVYAQEHPEIVEAVSEAWYKAVDYMKENPEEAYEMMAGGFEEVTAEDIAGDVEGLVFFGREENEELNNSEAERSIMAISQDMADFWMEKGECGSNDLTEYFSLLG